MKNNTRVKHIIAAGGSFAPVHKGHLNNWTSAIDHYHKYITLFNKNTKIEEILLLVFPVNNYTFKDSLKEISYDDRVKLIDIMIEEDCDSKYNIKVDRYHQNFKRIVYTDEEIKYVNDIYGINPVVLFGADNIIGSLGKGWNMSYKESVSLFVGNTFMCSCVDDENMLTPKTGEDCMSNVYSSSIVKTGEDCMVDRYHQRGKSNFSKIKNMFKERMKELGIESKLIIFKISTYHSNISSTFVRKLLIQKKYDKLLTSGCISPKLLQFIIDNKIW